MNFDIFNIDLNQPVDCFIKTCTFLAVGTGLEFASGFPPLLMDFAKFFAYLGASIAFWKFILTLIMPGKFKKEDK